MLASPAYIWGQDCIDFEEVDEILNELADICECNTTLQLGQTGTTSYLSNYLLGLVIENECVEIEGTLIVDQEVHFVNCSLKMGDGALISVNDWVEEIIFRDCNIQSCGDYLWDGIKLGNSNTLFFFDNVILHSLNGIHSDEGPVFGFIFNNVFNDNRYSISLGNVESYSQNSQLSLLGNIIAQSNELKDDWVTGRPLEPIDALSYGVQTRNAILNADASINPCEDRNIFYQLIHGYVLTNTSATIKANLFHDFRLEPDHGAGIVMGTVGKGSSSLNQKGWPTSDIETFKGVFYPIQTFETNTRISKNIIASSGEGIRVINARINNQIEDNSIEASIKGIMVYNNNARNMEIVDNSIIIDATSSFYPYSVGIEVMTYLNPMIAGSVRYNNIRLEPGDFGLLLVNTRKIYASCNTIHHLEIERDYVSGIEVRGGSLNKLVDNRIIGYYNPTAVDEGNGIKIIESPELELRWNRMTDTPFGLHFSGTSSNTEQVTNVFNSNNTGYFIDPSGITGHQHNPGNQWLGTFDLWEALNEGEIEPNLYFEHENLTSTSCWPSPSTWLPLQWFEETPTSGTCPTIFITECWKPDDDGPGPQFITVLDTMIAMDEIDFEDFPNRRKWQADSYLYRKLAENPFLIEMESVFDTFMTQLSPGPVAHYHLLFDSIANMVTPVEGLALELEELDSLLSEYAGAYLQALQSWIVHPDSLELWEEVLHVYNIMDSLFLDSRDLLHSWNTSVANSLSALESEILALATPNQYAANSKITLLAMVQAFPGPDLLSGSMVSDLEDIAGGCILEEGPAHFIATAIINQLGIDTLAFEVYCADPNASRIIPGQSHSTSIEFKIAPNPATDHIIISFTEMLDSDATLKISDITGRMHSKMVISSGSIQSNFPTDHLPNGSYIVTLELEGHISSQQLIIAK